MSICRCRRPMARVRRCSRPGPRRLRVGCASRTWWRSPTRRSVMLTSPCWRPACAPATWSLSRVTSRAPRRSCGRWRRGAGRRTTWRCGSSPRTRGSDWPRCVRPCQTSVCRCCSGGATRWATRRTRPTSPAPSSRRPRPPASTSSASSTRSTTSSRCDRRSRPCSRPGPPWPRWRSATPATSRTPARSSTRSTTTSGWPSGSWHPARTCWPSRTWPGCCARRPPGGW